MQTFTYAFGKANERRAYLKTLRYVLKTSKLNGAPLWTRKG